MTAILKKVTFFMLKFPDSNFILLPHRRMTLVRMHFAGYHSDVMKVR